MDVEIYMYYCVCGYQSVEGVVQDLAPASSSCEILKSVPMNHYSTILPVSESKDHLITHLREKSSGDLLPAFDFTFYLADHLSFVSAPSPRFAPHILSSRTQQVQQPVQHSLFNWSLLWSPRDVAQCRWSWDAAGSLIPTLWEMRFSCSSFCYCNFDQALMWLGTDPDMAGPGTCKRSPERRRRGESDLTSKLGEERNYSDGVFPLLLLCLVGNKGFMYSFYPGKKLQSIMTWHFFFKTSQEAHDLNVNQGRTWCKVQSTGKELLLNSAVSRLLSLFMVNLCTFPSGFSQVKWLCTHPVNSLHLLL